MEEKERYELFGEFGIIHDTSPNAECMLLNKFQTCEILNRQDKENQQLKQQLHDLPKKIVEEITNELSNNTSLYFEIRESTSAHCPNKEYEWFNYVRFRNYINTILKKYGVEKWKQRIYLMI